MFGCCLLLGQITILYVCITQVVINACSYTTGSHSVCAVRTLLGVDCKALSIRRNPCWVVLSFSLVHNTVYHLWLLATHTCFSWKHLSSLVCFECKAAIFIFGFHVNFLALFLTHSSGDVAIVILIIIIIITWAACTHLGMLKHLNFCDHYVANANIATSLIFNHCFNCYCTILTVQRRQQEQVAKSQLLKFLSHSLYVVKSL